jgi:hypothetical protein
VAADWPDVDWKAVEGVVENTAELAVAYQDYSFRLVDDRETELVVCYICLHKAVDVY